MLACAGMLSACNAPSAAAPLADAVWCSPIEYIDYTATVAWPGSADVLALLARSERAAFAPAGCGIDWQSVETRSTDAVPPGRQRVWRGSTCNCQGRIVEDSVGRIVGLGLRSAC